MRPTVPGSDAAVLYSGGTDSTFVALLMAEEFDRVHLLTYRRTGMFGVENSERNVERLIAHTGPGRFVRPRPYPCVDGIFRHLSYHDYRGNLRRHGFFNLTTCGNCKLAMHVQSILYCAANGVGTLRDGANRGMTIFPAQMAPVLPMIRALYERYGVEYDTPIYDLEDSQGLDFGSRLHGLSKQRPDPLASGMRTAGTELYQRGLLPAPDVKGTPEDRKMQARCYQFALFNVFVRWYYLQRHSYDDYVAGVVRYYSEQIAHCRGLLDEHFEAPGRSRLARLIEGPPPSG